MSANSEISGPRKRDRKIVSCAECRRLKLRCDRNVPCASCVRRGLQSICPTGTVSGSWKGNRTILASTEELYQQNEKLGSRIRDLENALAALHASTSDIPHPLLAEDLLSLKVPPGIAVNKDEQEEIVDAFGTLHISTDGSGLFYGTSAPSEMLMNDYEYSIPPAEDELPVNILLLSNQFPFNNVATGSEYLLEQMRALLPPLKEAWRLCELYFDNCAWLYRPFSRVDLVEEVITPIYEKKGISPVSGAQLSLLYITMALGTMVDFETPAYSATARQYQLLARACLATGNVLFTDEKASMAEGLILQGLLVKMAQSMGLHRDPENFRLSEVAVQRRRRVFWEIYVYDMWMSIMVGRPPAMSGAHIDAKMPVYPEDEGHPNGYHHTKLDFAQEYLRVFSEDGISGSKKPKYKRILQLDSDMRTRCVYSQELLVPGIDVPMDIDGPRPPMAQSMQRYALYMIREVLLLYLHRGYFAHAVCEYKDPLGGIFAPSVLATFRSARGVITCLKHAFMTEREATLRLSWFWSHAASSVVILAAIVTFAPTSLLAAPALVELDQTCEIFQQATSNRRVARFLPTVQKMQANAHDVLSRLNTGQPRADTTKDLQELSVMAGATHLVCKATQTPIFISGSQNAGTAGPVSFCVDAHGRALQFEGAHDSLMELYASLQQQQPAILDTVSSSFAYDNTQVLDDAFNSTGLEAYPGAESSLPLGGLFATDETGGSTMDWAQLMEQLGVNI